MGIAVISPLSYRPTLHRYRLHYWRTVLYCQVILCVAFVLELPSANVATFSRECMYCQIATIAIVALMVADDSDDLLAVWDTSVVISDDDNDASVDDLLGAWGGEADDGAVASIEATEIDDDDDAASSAAFLEAWGGHDDLSAGGEAPIEDDALVPLGEAVLAHSAVPNEASVEEAPLQESALSTSVVESCLGVKPYVPLGKFSHSISKASARIRV